MIIKPIQKSPACLFLGAFIILLIGIQATLILRQKNPETLLPHNAVKHRPNQLFFEIFHKHFHSNIDCPKHIFAKEIQHYQQNPYSINQGLKQASPYLLYLYKTAQHYHVPPEFILIPFVESRYNPFVFSRTGATGIWQMMESTAYHLQVPMNWWYDGRRDIVSSTRAAFTYLQDLYQYFNHDWLLALAAYNAGKKTVRLAIIKNKHAHKPTHFWNLKLPQETQHYVRKILALRAIFKNPKKYGLHLPDLTHLSTLASIRISHTITIPKMASLAQLSTLEFIKLNPGFRRNSTGPLKNYTILIPHSQKKAFETALKSYIAQINFKKMTQHIPPTPSKTKTISPIKNMLAMINLLPTYTLKKTMDKKFASQKVSSYLKKKRHTTLTLNSIKAAYPNSQHISLHEDHLPGLHRIFYQVKPSDSWKSISHKLKVSTRQIAYWNKMRLPSVPTQGKKLIIWHTYKDWKDLQEKIQVISF